MEGSYYPLSGHFGARNPHHPKNRSWQDAADKNYYSPSNINFDVTYSVLASFDHADYHHTPTTTMSQDYFSGKGKAPMSQEAQPDNEDAAAGSPTPTVPADGPPQFVTVGSGSTSVHAAQLQAMLDRDSGYGGSIDGGDGHVSTLGRDHATQPDVDRRYQAGAIHQLWYNQHRSTLGRSITKVVELLKHLQQMNAQWPAHYPSVQRTDNTPTPGSSSRPTFPHSFSTTGNKSQSRPASPVPPPALRRAMTAAADSHDEAESSRASENRPPEEPRLVTPQIAQDFSVLKLDLKLGSLYQAELVHSLEKTSIASLLDGQISSSIRHLMSLRERIEDTSSKVLITGDLNAGKSTFCNALLRRKVLPEDEQPCTAIFCEVLDARENGGIEEVHAVHKDAVYNRHDETTYDVFKLSELETIVVDNATYTLCKVYVKDVRTIDESLLNNGVVDIALIDAPGLNSDTTKTTAVFARQEEIDVVVFVVSAANHFTMTAKEFIWAAAKEKAYLFIVVNSFDAIRDKGRCKKMILEQVNGLSPRTFKESAELVHFVSSNAVPAAPGGAPGGNGSSSGGGGGGDDDDPGHDPKGKGKDVDKVRDFENLEQSLRRFVLEKRAKSKLAPAKTYLLNILNDVHTLATVNADVAQGELDRVTRELQEIEPQLASSTKARSQTGEELDQTIEATCKDVYDYTRTTLNSAITRVGDSNHGVQYRGLFAAFDYAEELKEAMMAHISESVAGCEEHARMKTVAGVNVIKQLGILHVGNDFQNLTFRPDVMFKRKRDSLARQVEIPTEVWDFVDWSTILQQQEKVAGTGMALTLAGAILPRAVGLDTGWISHAFNAAKIMGNDNLRRLLLPGIFAAAIAAGAYVISQIPNSLPHRLSNKISMQLASTDYVHENSTRISGSVRKVLRIPADNLRSGLERSVKDLGERREKTVKVRGESEVALKYFGNLVRKSAEQRAQVDRVDLDSPPPDAAAALQAH
ncbi:transmembrane GTPase fzo1 [Sodiomyces alkalinus F11]|uniref:Transmembrane GTPase fzo1 n=1 Tax=Sodiomyces alkalinus (strain CBS 110278 / VKM F-3762 / F11) TaxID=1314773 RepID=A0A3N2Q634_SODAK|nr:transmembrane GTPase fzo1 [Sodiomyces alkalinus F11]ROT42118.1 transmembrane GTPase fzo1 [Sodiomyces alkalinus F11]